MRKLKHTDGQDSVLRRLRQEPLFRVLAMLFSNVVINTVYIVIKLVSGICIHSDWLIAFALYYLVLTMLRVSLAQYVRRHPIGKHPEAEKRRVRITGILLLGLNIVLSVVIKGMVGEGNALVYPGVLIYAMAVYVFYAVIMAAVNLRRFRNHDSPILKAVIIVNLTAALAAMLSLEAAMIHRFGDPGAIHFRNRLLAVSGFAAGFLIVMMALYLIFGIQRKASRKS